MQLIHFAMQQKQTQYYKATVPQISNKKDNKKE